MNGISLVRLFTETLETQVTVCHYLWFCKKKKKQGFLDNQNAATTIDELEEYSDFERPVQSGKRTRRSSGNQKFRSRKSKTDDDWEPELPMDYF